ncbi:GNAT family N-acetyltransferase [Nonomuraea lactucae]|uniref:GNAT family N-acetyltransferase n=1 Tax=Nonomuraea lactucae TaxID=2249762 RepID=UPI000DE4D590|nr:N-acetyltransferase [Nonomuraea lactucae]
MPHAWITRPETGRDIPSIREVALAAFPTPLEADLIDALREDPAWIPGLSIVAEQPGEPAAPANPEDLTLIAGHALFTRCHVGEDRAPALALGPCSVLPRHQRQGAGSSAISAGLRAAAAMGESLVLVLGHPAYYPRFGFRRASAYGIRAPFEATDEAMMALVLDDTRPVPGGVIAYPAPFGV